MECTHPVIYTAKGVRYCQICRKVLSLDAKPTENPPAPEKPAERPPEAKKRTRRKNPVD